MGEVLRDYPRVVLEKRFLSEAEVSNLMLLAEGKYVRATVVERVTGDSVVDDYRTGSLVHLGVSPDASVKAIEERIAAVTGTRHVQGEAIQVVKYEVGDNYKPHFDWFDPALPGSQKQLVQGGQRMATCILYLKAAEEGGETEFPELSPPLKVKPESGDALFFYNLDPHGKPELLAKHAGLPPLKGEKIIATRWIRQRAADGSEESEAIKSKIAELGKLELAKKAAEKANEELQKAADAEGQLRANQCYEEINASLRKYNCKMWGEPGLEIGPGGVLKLFATVEMKPLPVVQQGSRP